MEPEPAMNFLSEIWQWLLEEKNRGALTLIGVGLAAAVTAGWTLFRYFRERKEAPQNSAPSNRSTRFNDAGAAPNVGRGPGDNPTIDTAPDPEQIQAINVPLLAANKDQATQVAQLSRQLGISEGAVGAFFAILGQEQIPPERWGSALAQIAQDHLSLLKRLESPPPDDAAIEEKTRAARQAVESGDNLRAEALLKECEELDLHAANHSTKEANTRLRHAAETRAARGELAMTRIGFLHESAKALYRQGEEKGDNAALTESIDARRNLLERLPRERVPLDWAMTQNNLGNALSSLGGRESGTGKLEEAAAAYRESLGEYTRERVPLDWAMTQNNLGNALTSLGERESGTGRLEEAVAAYREALKEHTRERVPLQWAMTQNNLGTALSSLGDRESGTGRLEEAVAAYREALKERTRERVPLDWATSQNNLGNALSMLGGRESGSGRLEEAVAAYRETLKEHTRERVPLQWATAQNNLGNALSNLGDRESGTGRLEEAVAAYREALEERTRERVPLDWAATQNNLGNTLTSLGERESGAASLEEAVVGFREALDVYQTAEADYYVKLVRANLQRAERLLEARR